MPKFRVLQAEPVGDVFNITFRDPRNGEEYVTSAPSLGKPALRKAIQDFFQARWQGGLPLPLPAQVAGVEQDIDVGEV